MTRSGAMRGAALAAAIGAGLAFFAHGLAAQTPRPAQAPRPGQTSPATPAPPPAQEQPRQVPPPTPGQDASVRGTYGAWQMRCDTLPGAQAEQCALVQTVAAADRQNVGLLVVGFRTPDHSATILRTIAPLGVYLPGGLGLKIDDTNIGSTDFQRCLPNGCVADAKLADDLITKLKTGKVATFIIFMTPEEGVGIPVSLDGFGQGLGALP